MGAEYELKFRATQESQESVFMTFPARWQTIAMETTYYDTPAGDLSARRYTLRRRMENGVSVCTLKAPGNGAERGEWDVRCDTIEGAIKELCKLSGVSDLETLCADGLLAVCGARFTRRAATLTLRECVLELALDNGVLLGGGREIPLCEIEAELKEGNREAVDRFARELAEIYNLQPEEKGKFVRALALSRGE